MIKIEVWKKIKGYDFYEVSNYGNIRSLDRVIVDSLGRNRKLKGCIRKQRISKQGYMRVNLYNGERIITERVHILIAKAFIENPENKPEVNHIDGNKKNNNVSNLEWCTRIENVHHMYKSNLKKIKKVVQKDLDGNIINEFDSVYSVFKILGFPKSSIRNSIYRKKDYNGFIWEYVE